MKYIKNVSLVEYQGIHYWLRINFGKANKCENKECLGKSQIFNWALKHNHIYEKKRKNFEMLCRSCHAKSDTTKETRIKVSKAQKGKSERDVFRVNKNCLECGKLVKNVFKATKYCKECSIIKHKQSLKKFAESKQSIVYKTKYYLKHKKKIQEYYKIYYQNNKKKYVER